MAEARVPPQNLEAEASVLGSILLDSGVLDRLEGQLLPQHFYRESHRQIFQAMLALSGRREPIDLVTLAEELRSQALLDAVGGTPYLIGLGEQVPTAAYGEHYAKIVLEKYALRELIRVAGEIMQSAYDQSEEVEAVVERAERRIFEVGTARRQQRFSPIRELVTESFEYITDVFERKGPAVGVRMGFRDLDELTSGLQPGGLVVLAARPSVGKTALALSIAMNVALRSSKAVAVFALEMSGMQLALRMLCSEARVDMSRVRVGNLAERDLTRLADTADKLSHAQLFIDDSPDLTVGEMRSRARRLMAEHDLGLICVDYLQLMSAGSGSRSEQNRQQEISAISRGLKGLARELDVPVLALSQLSRAVEARPSHRPLLSDLRESGALEQDADVVMFIYRDDYYDRNSERAGIAEIIVAKQRNGPTGVVELQFHAQHVRFNDLARNV